MLQCLRIERFRGISSLELEDAGRVNILVGANGSGKTSVLEALSIASNPAAPTWLATLSQWREMSSPSLGNDDALRAYFFGLDTALLPHFDFIVDGKRHDLTIRPRMGPLTLTSETSTSASASSSAPLESQVELRGITLDYHPPEQAPVQSTMSLVDQGFQLTGVEFPGRLGSFYVHARRSTSMDETARLLTSLYEQKREATLLETLQRVDPRLTRLWPGVRRSGPVVLADVGLRWMLPINLLGDGFCRVAMMATGLLAGNSKLLLVDEVDSGLHYSVMEAVWETMLALSIDRQIFCTTHDEEMLRATLEAFRKTPDALRIYRIARAEDGSTCAEKYTYETFDVSDRAGFEIR